jgi:hypothetical protein
MEHKEIEFENLSKRIVEQAYASANMTMSEEQKRKLIQDKFERAYAMHQAQKKIAVLED